MQLPSSSIMLLLSLAYLLPATLGSESPCPPSQLSVRLPPYNDPVLNASNTSSPSTTPSSSSSSSSSSWLAPPDNFFPGTWYVYNTSRASYREFGNLQWDLYPAIPTCEQNTTAACPPGTVAGVINEITTWVPNDNKTAISGAIGVGGRPVASIRAYDTPRRLNYPDLNSDWDAVFDNIITVGPGGGWSITISLLYWGSDASGLPFMIIHEGVATLGTGGYSPPCVDIISKNPTGPDEASVTDVMKALVDLGNADLTELIEGIGPVKWNDSLEGGPAICGTHCLRNEVI